MTKYIGYSRVSTRNQDISIPAQQDAITAFVEYDKGELIQSFNEVVSGKKGIKPQLQAAIDHCKITGATLIVAKLDRISRSLAELIAIRDSGIELHICDNPKMNAMMFGIYALMAEQERQLISDRTKTALAKLKRDGVKLGNPNLHLARTGDTTAARDANKANADKYRALVSDKVIEAYKTAGSYRKAAALLNERHIKTSRGGQWQATTVKRVIDKSA